MPQSPNPYPRRANLRRSWEMTTTIPNTPPLTKPPSTEPHLEPAVCVAGVSHSYGSRRALDDVSLQIGGGEMFAVLGPNGGGKTTLFRVLSTLIPLQSGAVSILGHDLAREQAAVRRQIGVVFQSPSL